MDISSAASSHDGNCTVLGLDATNSPRLPRYFDGKAMGSRLAGGLLLVGAAPLVIILCALVKLTSRGPALYRQVRVGKDGRRFEILKLRTMYTDAEGATGPTWCLPADSRITPLGKWLRFTHLDELPQLVNVMRGEMDLVGPRPERPEIIEREELAIRIPGYHIRHRVRPGVTGLAQVNLPPDQTLDCVRAKVALDIEYVDTASLLLDLKIILCTAVQMTGLRRDLAARWLKVHRHGMNGIAAHRVLSADGHADQWSPEKPELAIASQRRHSHPQYVTAAASSSQELGNHAEIAASMKSSHRQMRPR
jgi:lipopolysaccharide/colanic/teichoic acid biosynthesis glycosyltransferase